MKQILLMLLMLFMLIGCRKDISFGDYSHAGMIDISIDWGETSDIPDGIIAYFYSDDTLTSQSRSKPIVQYISNRGADIYLPFGSFYSFIYNDYTENICFRDMDKLTKAAASLEQSSKDPLGAGTSNMYIDEAELFYTTQVGSFTLDKDSSVHEVVTYPLLKTIEIEIEISVEGIHNVAAARGTLSGVAKSVNLSMGEVDRDEVAHIVLDFKISDTGLVAKIKCFGVFYDKEKQTVLEVAFILKDKERTRIFRKQNITEDIQGSVREFGGTVKLYLDEKIEDIEIDGGDGGFDPDIGDWDDVIIEELQF